MPVARSPWRSCRPVTWILALTLVVSALLVPAVARAATFGSRAAGVMLTRNDLPSGFEPIPALTGPFDDVHARVLGLTAVHVGPSLDGRVNGWASAQAEVIEIGMDAGDHAEALVARDGARESMARLPSFTIPGRPDVVAAVASRSNGLLVQAAAFAEGPYFFELLVVGTPGDMRPTRQLLGRLVTLQSHRVPQNTPEESRAADDLGYVMGVAVGGIVLYLLVLDGVAWLIDPLRRRRSKGISAAFRGFMVSDASRIARAGRRRDVWRLIMALIGIGILALGNPYRNGAWPLCIAGGAALVWASSHYRVLSPRNRSRWEVPGYRRSMRVSVLLGGAGSLALTGYLLLVAGAYTAANAQYVSTGPDYATAARLMALLLLALAAVILRRARRRGALEARELLRRDPRPPVLYLRAFGDDRLRLRAATLGRRSLLEKLSPRRFDRFEEIVVRSLSGVGPVVALTPPGETLPPLGAARESLAGAAWQPKIREWMEQAALIVLTLPPDRLTEGLRWELETLSHEGRWDKALIVVPPLPARTLSTRWSALLAAPGIKELLRLPPGVPALDPLVLTRRSGSWSAITAKRRSEQSYDAALSLATGSSEVPPPVPASSVQQPAGT
jgi:hypothetical protein